MRLRVPSSLIGLYRYVLNVIRTHQTLTIILLGLFLATGVQGPLRGDLLGSSAIQFGGQEDDDDDLRTCSGMHTVFEEFETIADTQEEYIEMMSSVFYEHELILRTPNKWKCGPGKLGEAPTPVLNSLASVLPGWSVFPSSGAAPVQRPVSFDAFSAVVSELQREYECKLVELQDRAVALISRNKDHAPGQFCCTELGCIPSGDGSLCSGPETDDSLCDNQCPVYFTTTDLATRLGPFSEAIDRERQRSRNALERSLFALRSADIHYEVARQLVCYQRASLDLRNELNLTADAISCMPKIWDALTSLHDKKQ